jgi:hypothetical protein
MDFQTRIDLKLRVLGHLCTLIPCEWIVATAQAVRRSSQLWHCGEPPLHDPPARWPFLMRTLAPWPSIGGRWSNIVKRVLRSTSVPSADRFRPMTGSPS